MYDYQTKKMPKKTLSFQQAFGGVTQEINPKPSGGAILVKKKTTKKTGKGPMTQRQYASAVAARR